MLNNRAGGTYVWNLRINTGKIRQMFAYVLLISMSVVPCQSLASSELAIDLIKGTLNGTPLSTLTIDQVTDMLGRPSASDRYPELVGAHIYYHSLGLQFWFNAPYMTPGNKHLLLLIIYLSKTWDSERSNFFMPFEGKLNPAATANWKVQRTLKELAQFGVVTETPPEQYEAEVKARQQQYGISGSVVSPFHRVSLKGETTEPNFFHEPTTKFLEHIYVYVMSFN